MALQLGAKAFGGGAAQAAPAPAAGPNPLTAGLMGMGQEPPMPERNPMFSGSIDNPMLDNLKKQGARDVTKAFDSPDTPTTTETVQGTAAPNPASSNVGLLSATVQPSPDLPERNPAFSGSISNPPRIDLGGENISRGSTFDTSAPKAPTQAASSGFGDGTGWLKGVSDKLKGVPTNPLAQTSLGLLQSGYDGSNPWAAIAGNLNRIPGMELAAAANARAQGSYDKKNAEDEDSAAKMAQLLMLMKGSGTSEEEEGRNRPLARRQGQAAVVR